MPMKIELGEEALVLLKLVLQGSNMPGAPEILESIEEQEVLYKESLPDCMVCGGTGWLHDYVDGGTMTCDGCDGVGKVES